MITYTDSLTDITPDHLRGGFFAGWARPLTPEAHWRTLQGADGFVLAIDDSTGSVVGYITMLTDGVLSAFIPYLEVLEAYHRQGIGSELMRRMLDKLSAIPNIDLLCDAEMQPYYARFGMQPVPGMVIRKRHIPLDSL